MNTKTTLKPLTKKERKAIRLQNHYNAIEKLIALCGGSKLQVKTISNRLRALEFTARKYATKYNNGELTESDWAACEFDHETAVQKLFNGNLKGLYINSDSRGCALQISDGAMISEYSEIGLQRNLGGNGLLAPKINGN